MLTLKNKLDDSSVILWERHRAPFMHILAHILITLSFTLNVSLSWCPAKIIRKGRIFSLFFNS